MRLRFWKGRLVVPDASDVAMGQFGGLRSLAGLPSKKALLAYVWPIMGWNEQDVTSARATRSGAPVPPSSPIGDLLAALENNRKANAVFEASSPGLQREYFEWITGARRVETRARGLSQSVEWLAEGESQLGTRNMLKLRAMVMHVHAV